ncbi:hypothetical protein E3A20_04800 [Planctomyces bekefii]|jgi:hypothetical protein|uniref:Pectate lyase n=1 Tax=Planctomyces bekefii TaxID=1653850 RepID=A0A5C6MAX3_9PLAN|nr:hypothetical protein E3A20_04800 [Planctomyces bekefii]
MRLHYGLRQILVTVSLGIGFNMAAQAADQGQSADGDDKAIARCLEVWGKAHPFQGVEKPSYKTMAANVKVMGVGDGIEDHEMTKKAQLILVKPSVAVMTKNRIRMLNPMGWYCLKANVTVMSKTTLELACTASVADSIQGVSVLGSNKSGTGSGVTVMGKTEIKRVGCSSAGDK